MKFLGPQKRTDRVWLYYHLSKSTLKHVKAVAYQASVASIHKFSKVQVYLEEFRKYVFVHIRRLSFLFCTNLAS